jgi:putative aldouronate transport system permease protein
MAADRISHPATSTPIKPTAGRRANPLRRHLGQIALNFVLGIITLLFLVPLLVVISASFTDDIALTKFGYGLWPSIFSVSAYSYILAAPEQMLRAYGVTTFVTLVGTIAGVLIMSLFGYALSRTEFTWRRPISFLIFFTMLFSGGLVPVYILVTQYLKLRDTLLVLIIPYLFSPWYVFLMRTFFSQLPREIIDSARIDGANEWQIYGRIVMPLSTPAIATVGLFLILQYWNDYWLSLLYINDAKLYPVQYLLYAILRNAEFITSNTQGSAMLGSIRVPVQTIRMAMAVIAMGPVAIAFLSLQRYFVRGLTIGGIKGE